MSSNINTKCRTCLGESSIYHQLFDYVEEDYKILEMLECIVPQINIKATTLELSHLVCKNCVDKLLIGYKFQQLCIETNKRLHDLLGIAGINTEQNLDPLAAEINLELKQEIEDVCYESELPTDNLSDITKPGDNDKGSSSNLQRSSKAKLRSSARHTTGKKQGYQAADILQILEVYEDEAGKKIELEDKPEILEEFPVTSSSSKPKHIEGKEPKIKRVIQNRTCKECGHTLARPSLLKIHYSTVHSPNRPHECKICKYRFETTEKLKLHLRIHFIGNNVEKYKCPDCPKKFWSRSSFAYHKKKQMCLKNIKIKRSRFENKATESKLKKIENVCLKNEIATDNLHDDFTTIQDANSIPEIDSYSCSDSNSNPLNPQTTTVANNKQDVANILEVKEYALVEEETVVKEELEILHTVTNFENSQDDIFTTTLAEPTENIDKGELPKNVKIRENEIKELSSTSLTEETKNIKEVDAEKMEVLSNSRKKKSTCKECGNTFDRPSFLRRHLDTVHSLNRPYECEICKYRFATIEKLKRHMLVHNNNSTSNSTGDLKCPVCPRKFILKTTLSSHLKTHTSLTTEIDYPCTICNKRYMTKKSLRTHLETHKDNNDYLCPKCGKTFRTCSSYSSHKQRHESMKTFQCSECPKSFACQSYLIKHKRTHSNIKPYVCDTCGSRFVCSTSLGKHKVIHTGQRPFKCQECNMTFAIIFNLRRHMRTHTGEKPYKCTYCERAYAESGDLTKHLRTHVGKNTYMCDQCPKAFKYQAELRQHQSDHYKKAQKLLRKEQNKDKEEQNE